MNLPEEAYFFAALAVMIWFAFQINPMIDWLDKQMDAIAAKLPKKPVRYGVGDKVPQPMKDAWAEGKGVGAFVSVCPCCDRIDNIFHP